LNIEYYIIIIYVVMTLMLACVCCVCVCVRVHSLRSIVPLLISIVLSWRNWDGKCRKDLLAMAENNNIT